MIPAAIPSWVDTLGFTLLHFCWQAAAVALAYVVSRALLSLAGGSTPERLHRAAAISLIAIFVLPVATFALLFEAAAISTLAPLPVLAPIPAIIAGAGSPEPAGSVPWTLWLVSIWLTGVALLSLRLAVGLRQWQRIRGSALRLDDSESQPVRALARRLHLTGTFEIRVSREVASPLVTGLFRYTLLLPVTFFSGLSAAQADAILAHELAHMHRRDGILNLLQAIAETLFFFHPAVWWLSAELRRQREMACDEMAASLIGNRTTYAEALLALEELRPAHPRFALAARSGSLEERVRRVLEADTRPQRDPLILRTILLLGIAVLAGSLWAASASFQSAPPAPEPPPAPAPPPARAPSPTPRARAVPPAPAEAPAPVAPPAPADAPAPAKLAQSAPPAPQPPAPRPGGYSAPLSQAERQQRLEALRQELKDGAYKRWVLEDAAYIIRDEELTAYQRLTTDAEREFFIQQFWARRDPTPGTEANEAKEEHYRRISYANGRFGVGDTPGWRTDRGRLYIQYGPPDEIEARPNDGPEGYQRWFYREIKGVGQNVSFEFGKRPTPTF